MSGLSRVHVWGQDNWQDLCSKEANFGLGRGVSLPPEVPFERGKFCYCLTNPAVDFGVRCHLPLKHQQSQAFEFLDLLDLHSIKVNTGL